MKASLRPGAVGGSLIEPGMEYTGAARGTIDVTTIERYVEDFAGRAMIVALAVLLLVAMLGLNPAQAAPPGTPAPVRMLPFCDRSTDPPSGACAGESEFVDLSSLGALSGGGSVQLTATPRIPPCETGNTFTGEWSPSVCYSAIQFNQFGFCRYLDQITGEFLGCQDYNYQDGTTPFNGYAGNMIIRTSPALGNDTGTRSGCGAGGDFFTYAYGGPTNSDPALDRRWSNIAPTANTCTHSIARTPDNLFGATWHATSVTLDVRRNGETSTTKASAGVFYILEGTLGPTAPDPNENPPPDPDPFEVNLPTPTGTGTARISLTPSNAGEGCAVSDAETLNPPAPPPDGITLPHGVFGFTFSGCASGFSVEASIAYPSAIPAGSAFYKYDGGRGWFTIPADISGDTVTFTITDNGPGDLDPAAGTIRDPGGIGFFAASASSVAIPTLPQWGLGLLAGLLILLASIRFGRGRFHG